MAIVGVEEEYSFQSDLNDLCKDDDLPIPTTKEEEEEEDVLVLNYDRRQCNIDKKIEHLLENQKERNMSDLVFDEDYQYQVIAHCNELALDIDNEIAILHNFIRDKYRFKFPELQSLIPHPIDYARVVLLIGNQTDLTSVDLHGILPSSLIMVLSITASTTTGKPLTEQNLNNTIHACNLALSLDSSKQKLLDFIDTKMGYVSPNLSAIVGSAVAAKLMVAAGGLSALSAIPACNVLALGTNRNRNALLGFSNSTSLDGFLHQTQIFQSTPPSLANSVLRLLGYKSTLAARLDSMGGDPTGTFGRTLRDDIFNKIHKLQELPPAKQVKPLPIPDSNPRKKRGGLRLRKMKRKYEMTANRKHANRIQFGAPDETLYFR